MAPSVPPNRNLPVIVPGSPEYEALQLIAQIRDRQRSAERNESQRKEETEPIPTPGEN